MSGAVHHAASVEATERLGEGLAAALAPGDGVALLGDLGAGTTRFGAGNQLYRLSDVN